MATPPELSGNFNAVFGGNILSHFTPEHHARLLMFVKQSLWELVILFRDVELLQVKMTPLIFSHSINHDRSIRRMQYNCCFFFIA